MSPHSIRGTSLLALIVLATITCGVIALTAQDKQDFLGRWVLADDGQSGPEIPPVLTVSLPARATTGHDPTIVVERQFQGSASSETYSIGIVGGTVPGLREDGTSSGPTTHHRTVWEGKSLVFESGSHTGPARETGVWSERTEVWSVTPDGQLRVEISTRTSAKPLPTSTRLLYTRR